ncbi:isocitrate/isopropylmalate family dehydrogenase [Acinetobacter baumannii]
MSAVMMLHHLGEHEKAEKIRGAILKVCAEGHHLTGDLGGHASTTEFAKAIIDAATA